MSSRGVSLFAAFVLLLAGCDDTASSDTTVDQGVDQGVASNDDAAVDASNDADAIDALDGDPPILLPRDEKPHGDPVEWWYYTGLLRTPTGDEYGFEMVIFQALVTAAPLYIGHFAVADLQLQSFLMSSEATAGAQQQPTDGFALEAGKLQMTGHAGRDHLVASIDEGPGYALDLQLVSDKPPVLQYATGIMTVGSDEPFYYYSYTRMKTTGQLTVGAEKLQVSGWTWMDHQWGDIGDNFDGWNWYSLRLDDNSELMFFVVKRSAGDFVGGTYIAADGSYEALYDGDFSITPTGEWTSPHTDATYPHGWTVRVPSKKLDVAIAPRMADQEFYEQLFGQPPIYWEGLCGVSGTQDGEAITGHAYVELTGYADAPNPP
jgi:predicted secreted hydrolase